MASLQFLHCTGAKVLTNFISTSLHSASNPPIMISLSHKVYMPSSCLRICSKFSFYLRKESHPKIVWYYSPVEQCSAVPIVCACAYKYYIHPYIRPSREGDFVSKCEGEPQGNSKQYSRSSWGEKQIRWGKTWGMIHKDWCIKIVTALWKIVACSRRKETEVFQVLIFHTEYFYFQKLGLGCPKCSKCQINVATSFSGYVYP